MSLYSLNGMTLCCSVNKGGQNEQMSRRHNNGVPVSAQKIERFPPIMLIEAGSYNENHMEFGFFTPLSCASAIDRHESKQIYQAVF